VDFVEMTEMETEKENRSRNMENIAKLKATCILILITFNDELTHSDISQKILILLSTPQQRLEILFPLEIIVLLIFSLKLSKYACDL